MALYSDCFTYIVLVEGMSAVIVTAVQSFWLNWIAFFFTTAHKTNAIQYNQKLCIAVVIITYRASEWIWRDCFSSTQLNVCSDCFGSKQLSVCSDCFSSTQLNVCSDGFALNNWMCAVIEAALHNCVQGLLRLHTTECVQWLLRL